MKEDDGKEEKHNDMNTEGSGYEINKYSDILNMDFKRIGLHMIKTFNLGDKWDRVLNELILNIS
jgi:hypothetical protein